MRRSAGACEPMTLIPIEHERRLASPAEVERFFRGLGEKVVSARGFHTRDAERIARVVAAVQPKREHTVSFESGTLDANARAALDALAHARFEYLDVRTNDADLRIWPKIRSWVHARGSAETAGAALGAPLRVGENAFGDATVTIAADDRIYPIDVKTESVATALRIFHALSGEHVERGFIDGVHERTKPLLDRLLQSLSAQVNAVLEIDVAAARELTELYPGQQLDWQAGGVLVDFPEGRIHGFLKTPNTGPRDAEKWQARVTKALRRAKLA